MFHQHSIQIRALDIEFWNKKFDDLQRQHQRRMYPPRIKMTVRSRNPDSIFKIPIKFIGCSSDSNLDLEITFPLGERERERERKHVLCCYDIWNNYDHVGLLYLRSPSSSSSSGSLMDTRSHAILCKLLYNAIVTIHKLSKLNTCCR